MKAKDLAGAPRWRWRKSPEGFGDDSGAELVEFALVMLPLALMLFGVIQFGTVFAGWASLRNSVQSSARMLAIDAPPNAGDSCAEASGAPTALTGDWICEIVNAIGTPPGTSSSGLVIALSYPGPSQELSVCASLPIDSFTGLFSAFRVSTTSTFYIEQDDQDIQSYTYNPNNLSAC